MNFQNLRTIGALVYVIALVADAKADISGFNDAL